MVDYNKLQLTKAEMKEIGYRVIDSIIDHFDNIRDIPASAHTTRAHMEKLLREPLPLEPQNIDNILDVTNKVILKNNMHLDHPKFFAFISGPSNFISVLADTLASGFNVFSGTWLEGSSAAQIELITIDWLKQIFGLDNQAGGLFVSGGSVANLTALRLARYAKLQDDNLNLGTVYYSDQTHSSVTRAISVLGIKEENIRIIKSDKMFRLNTQDLVESIHKDKRSGLMPFCVIANAGTTNTGSIDPLKEIHAICKKENTWMHVDGAYGAAAMLCQKGKALLDGIQLADSFSLDPHKWLFQPYELGCVMVKNANQMKECYRIIPEYLKDTDISNEEINYCDYGIQLTRGFRAFKLWMSMKYFGVNSFSKAVEHGIDLADYAESILKERSNWEIVFPAQIGIINFRYNPENEDNDDYINRLNDKMVYEIVNYGFAMISTTILEGKKVIRLNTINPRTEKKDIYESILRLEEIAKNLKNYVHPF